MVMAKISTISNTSFGTYHIAKYVDSLYQLHPLIRTVTVMERVTKFVTL